MKQEHNTMANKPIFPLLMKMAIPPMLSMLIQSMYNIIDSIFVAKLGEKALTALSLAFPLQNLSLAFSVGLGVAINALIAQNLGAKKNNLANNIASHGIFLSLLHSLLFIFIGVFLIKPFFSIFTNDPETLNYAITYGSIVITLTFGSIIHITIEKMFQATGNMIIPMFLQVVGAVVNIILDPILIFGINGYLKFGVSGAAIATIIGQISACLLAILLFRKKSFLKLSLTTFKPNLQIIKNIYSIAIPSGVMTALPSILVTLLNGLLTTVNQSAIAFLGIYFKLQSFVYMPANGLIQGMRPLISYNFGAKHFERVKKIIKVSIIVTSVILCSGALIFMTFPKFILSWFNATSSLLNIGIIGLRIFSICFIVSSVSIVISGTFESLGNGKYSLTISLLRQLIITVPLAHILLFLIGLNGVWLSFLIAECIASIVSIILLKKEILKFSSII
ncbi:MATE family efflux transporter [Thomasclavelia cocleata]|uniref:Probable multidrug resistance protein NorM n=1 Tax=Thomasclavelia cocleata TaxID=69824 RepID=A0A1I0GIH5_9FIRM|nr:MATE family efflux transporter [Thomasclavelia cocleata]MCR1961957.1 MATE family efflux transporter [Thomasclavelia cocleata]NDO43232.1 MATE family efflux transporter [Thomasclavelia cocleata]PJN81815.1 MATE family efflux transporter [Thomasclavelia cocleata]SET70977.1 putative efflux protein, MATE family [Thomasclavelia cocleata]